MAPWRSGSSTDHSRWQNAALRLEVDQLRESNTHLRRALLAILKDPRVQLFDDDRDEGWVALGGRRAA